MGLRNSLPEWAQLRPITAQIVDVVRRLHDFGAAHRDISIYAELGAYPRCAVRTWFWLTELWPTTLQARLSETRFKVCATCTV